MELPVGEMLLIAKMFYNPKNNIMNVNSKPLVRDFLNI
jgi:hypothetical protein